MRLSAGERYTLADEQSYIVLTAGKAEAYAVTRRKGAFRQMFLAELASGEAAFPSMDEFDEIDVVIYAVTDAEFSVLPMAEAEPGALASLMTRWFGRLVSLPWLRLLADRGDDLLKTWESGSVLDGKTADMETLLDAFAVSEGIFSMLLGVRFKSQDRQRSLRLETRVKRRRRLLDETIADLLGEEVVSADADAGGKGSARIAEVTFIVRCAAHALKMPSKDISVAPEMAKKLDTFGILRRLVQKSGMQIRSISLENGWHIDDSGVMFGYLAADGKRELAALIPDAPNRYRAVTEARPEGIPVTDEVAAQMERDAILCYPGLPPRKLSFMDLFKFMFQQSWASDWKTLVAVSIVMGLIPMITPIVTETMFKDIIPILDRKGLATVTQVLMVAGFTTAALSTVRSVTFLRLSASFHRTLRAAIFGRLLSLPIKFFRDFQAGDLANRMVGIEAVTTLFAENFFGELFGLVFSLWSLGLMCYYSWKLTAAALGIWIVYLVLSGFVISRLVRSERRMTAARNKTSGILQQIFTGLVKFRAKGAEEEAYHLWGKQFAEEWKWNYSARVLKNWNTVIAAVQPILLALALYYLGIKELAESSAAGGGVKTAASTLSSAFPAAEPMSTATFIAFQAAYTAFNASLNAVMPVLEQLSAIRPQCENLRPILDAEPEVLEEKIEADMLSGAFEVRHLSFSYGEGLPEVLHDVSFRVAAGEHVAIVGRSGCGKSTLVRLLLGFESPTNGAIYYDGQDLSELDLPSVRAQMGVVLQNGQLMTGDIFHNIVGTNNLTLDDAWAAAEAAGIADDIREMPMQMQTIVSEGSTNISGGQRQRILIAKALAMKPAIVICDEATSALDNRTQAIVTESLDRMEATRLVVAHRLSTIRHADRILVLDGGRIAESGTFGELVEKGGLFASFVKRQVA